MKPMTPTHLKLIEKSETFYCAPWEKPPEPGWQVIGNGHLFLILPPGVAFPSSYSLERRVARGGVESRGADAPLPDVSAVLPKKFGALAQRIEFSTMPVALWAKGAGSYLYLYRNPETGHQFTVNCKYAELVEYLGLALGCPPMNEKGEVTGPCAIGRWDANQADEPAIGAVMPWRMSGRLILVTGEEDEKEAFSGVAEVAPAEAAPEEEAATA